MPIQYLCMTDPNWIDKLKPLVQRDLTLRQVLLEKGTLSDAYHPEMEKLHLENASKLKKLIDKMGFPVLSNAGEEGVRLSWLIIQHSISSPSFMRESLLQMRLAAAEKDYVLELLAYTEDKVAYFEGRPQIYGTNSDWQNGELKPTPILDPGSVDVRRRSIGLPPLFDAMSVNSLERPPKDPSKKAKEFEEWRARVGWQFWP